MDEPNRINKYSIKMSIQSRNSIPSSIRSLDRPSWTSRPNSINKKMSLLDVMSLESGRKSDIYDKILFDQAQHPQGRQSMGGLIDTNNYNQYDTPYDNPKLIQRRSQQLDATINHTCKCYTECEWESCPCLQASDQICLIEFCCAQCIEHKKMLLKGKIQTQNQMFCTCKKTKCNKKYCTCFAAGIMCGQKCSCEGCINCPKKQSTEMDIQPEDANQIPQQQLAKMQMPESMDFQPFQFNGRSSN